MTETGLTPTPVQKGRVTGETGRVTGAMGPIIGGKGLSQTFFAGRAAYLTRAAYGLPPTLLRGGPRNRGSGLLPTPRHGPRTWLVGVHRGSGLPPTR